MGLNFIAILVAALVPMALGFIYYHPKVLGGLWMKETGLTEESMKGGNMALVFGVSFVLALMLSFNTNFVVVHQNGVEGSLYYALKDPARHDAAQIILNKFFVVDNVKGEYSGDGRSIKHGVIHGILASLFFMLPILGTNAMFERKSFKYIAVNAGYWTICLAIMGAIIAAWK